MAEQNLRVTCPNGLCSTCKGNERGSNDVLSLGPLVEASMCLQLIATSRALKSVRNTDRVCLNCCCYLEVLGGEGYLQY